jgi:hypothetical protein
MWLRRTDTLVVIDWDRVDRLHDSKQQSALTARWVAFVYPPPVLDECIAAWTYDGVYVVRSVSLDDVGVSVRRQPQSTTSPVGPQYVPMWSAIVLDIRQIDEHVQRSPRLGVPMNVWTSAGACWLGNDQCSPIAAIVGLHPKNSSAIVSTPGSFTIHMT